MSDRTADLRIEMAWVQRLAGALVRDPASAEDLAQEVWVAALAQRPDASGPFKPWLRAVARNLSRLRARSLAREEKRRLLLQDAEHSLGADELLARVQTERELVELVCALEEPYRAVVLLRYHEGYSAARIAVERGAPAGTVRWQLKVGLDRIREALAARHAENSQRALALVVLVSLKAKLGLIATAVILLLATLLWPRTSAKTAQRESEPILAVRPQVDSTPAAPVTPARVDQFKTKARARKIDALTDSGAPMLFGQLVAMGQGFTLAEMLSKNASNADRYVDLFCDKAKTIRQKPRPGGEPGTSSDAASFMAPLMDYEKPLDDPPGKLHFAAPFRDRIHAYGDDWPALITDQDLAGLDFAWLHALEQFDHWSVYGAGRLRDVPTGGNIYASVIPNYTSLLYWAKLRFAASLRTGDTLQANQDIEHLSMLIRSQDLLIGVGVSLLMARYESQMRGAFVAQGGDISKWAAPDLGSLQEEKQLEFASIYFSYPGVSEATLRKAFACMPSPCTSLMEGAAANQAIGAFIDSDNSALIRSLSQERDCDQAPFDRAFASDGLTSEEALSSQIGDLDTEIPRLLVQSH
jgi:RNA polymerase sigma factor (sigma-70 family)